MPSSPMRAAIASLVDGPDARVAIAAQRAQWAEDERVVIAAMPWMMIGDRGRRDAVLLLAQGAERVLVQLMVRASTPGLQRIPGPPRQRLGGCEVACGHGRGLRALRLSLTPRQGLTGARRSFILPTRLAGGETAYRNEPAKYRGQGNSVRWRISHPDYAKGRRALA